MQGESGSRIALVVNVYFKWSQEGITLLSLEGLAHLSHRVKLHQIELLAVRKAPILHTIHKECLLVVLEEGDNVYSVTRSG